MNLRARGVLLVVIPLIRQLVIVSLLFLLLRQSYAQLCNESRERDLVSLVHRANTQIIEVLAVAYWVDDSQKSDIMMDQAATRAKLQKFAGSVNQLVDIARPIRTLQQIETLKQVVQRTCSFFEWCCVEQSKGMQHWLNIKGKFDDEVMQHTRAIITALSAMSGGSAPVGSMELRASRAQMQTFLMLGFASGVVVAVIAVFAFAKGLRKPVNHLMINSQRLSCPESLLPAIDSKDEFGELDRLLHDVSHILVESLEKEKAMLDNAASLICSLDEAGDFSKVNSYASRITGYTCDELVNKSFFDIVHKDDLSMAERDFFKVKGSNEKFEFELRLVRNDATVIDTRWTGYWSDFDACAFCVVRDITEQKNIEVLKQDLIDMISHDLRSPLTSILGSMTLVAAGAKGPLTQPVDDLVNQAVRKTELLIDCVNNLLDYQKFQSGRMSLTVRPISFSMLLAEALLIVGTPAEDKNVDIDFVSSDAQLNCDADRLVRLLTIVLSQAVDDSPPGKSILIEIAGSEGMHEVKIHFASTANVNPFDDPFAFQTEFKRHGGTGISLALCQQIAKAHLGDIEYAFQQNTVERFARKRMDRDACIWIRLGDVSHSVA